ncbi:unnamed protein product [Sphacelaria rigidula]
MLRLEHISDASGGTPNVVKCLRVPAPTPPTHATFAVDSGSRPVHSERAAPVGNQRDIAGGHAGEMGAVRERLSSPSYGEKTATVLFSASEASIATTDGASVQNQGSAEGYNNRRSALGCWRCRAGILSRKAQTQFK